MAEYCGSAEGLLKELKSEKEARQRKATMLSLVELHGDKALGEITSDDLRAFRDWVRTWPANANNLGQLRRPTMMESLARPKLHVPVRGHLLGEARGVARKR